MGKPILQNRGILTRLRASHKTIPACTGVGKRPAPGSAARAGRQTRQNAPRAQEAAGRRRHPTQRHRARHRAHRAQGQPHRGKGGTAGVQGRERTRTTAHATTGHAERHTGRRGYSYHPRGQTRPAQPHSRPTGHRTHSPRPAPNGSGAAKDGKTRNPLKIKDFSAYEKVFQKKFKKVLTMGRPM